jgi:hypothetical protein
MASFVVERFGPEQLLSLDRNDIYERARSFRELSHIPELQSLTVA